jgi:hypothetical protein
VPVMRGRLTIKSWSLQYLGGWKGSGTWTDGPVAANSRLLLDRWLLELLFSLAIVSPRFVDPSADVVPDLLREVAKGAG